jgi:hypothetical protein
MHVFADERGVMYPCCRSVGTRKPNVDADGKPYRVFDDGALAASWNSGYMKKLRLDMLEGARPAPCSRCYMYDDLGMRSHRQDINDEYEARIPAMLGVTAADGSVPLELQSVDLRLGNLCNLRCRMCSPQSSKGLIGEFAAAYGVSTSHRSFDELRRMNWFETPAFWEIFEQHTQHVERLHFAGGEPLIIPQMFDFLERLAESGRAGHISLSYNTNLTTLPERVYRIWPAFKQVRVTVSLDGVREVNSFIRFPSVWAEIDANLRRLERDYDTLNLRGGIASNTTVQIYNVLRIDELLEYFAGGFTRVEAPNLSVLTQPRHLGIQALPAPLKTLAVDRLRAATDRLAGRWPERWRGAELDGLLSSIDGIIQHMLEKDDSAILPEFRRWTAIQDEQRGQRTPDLLPELGSLFS